MNFVKDEKGNNVEGLSKQEIYAVLQQAIEDGDLENIDAESAFVSKLKCCVGGESYQIAFVTQAVYNELLAKGQLIANALYFITDDNTETNIEEKLEELQNDINGLDARLVALGFKEGSCIIADSSNVTVLKNSLKRQGNYVICDLNFEYKIGKPNDGSILFSLPDNFKMKTGSNIISVISGYYVAEGNACGIYYIQNSNNDLNNFKLDHFNWVSGEGYKFVCDIKFGYEAEPINVNMEE